MLNVKQSKLEPKINLKINGYSPWKSARPIIFTTSPMIPTTSINSGSINSSGSHSLKKKVLII